jgi:anthranilate synthase component 2
MILVIDNYDSFVHNLARYVRELGWDAMVRRNDALTVEEVERLAPSHIILSPGPCTPAESGISNELIQRLGPATPILGVCLGHQCIGAAYGGEVVRAGYPRHGRTSRITHDGSSIFTGLPRSITVARYHSLVIARPALPESLRVLATADDDREIMAVAHRTHPVIGVQFHPESAATEYGYSMMDWFLSGGRSRAVALPRHADGSDRLPEDARPWAPPGDEPGPPFVPPPVELVR